MSTITAEVKKLNYSSSNGNVIIRGYLTIHAGVSKKCRVKNVVIASKVFPEQFCYPVICSESGGRFRVEIPFTEVRKWYPNNQFLICVEADDKEEIVPVKTPRRTNPMKRNIINCGNDETVCHFKETLKYLWIQVRQRNVTDSMFERFKIALAFGLSRITRSKKTILLFEKFCNSYEESASVVFEKLIDSGYTNARFILSREFGNREVIDSKYEKYIIDRFSLKHYYAIFTTKSVFSSEAIGHLLEKRCASRLFNRQVKRGFHYVFLQHGVMYMVSLGSEQRSFYQKSKSRKKQRVVVSSELEARHFTDNTDYTDKDIYVTGLAKFDRSVLNDDADKITIIPTWRPWENVKAQNDEKSSTYYRMLRNMIEAVPEELRDKLIVMPHPRMSRQSSGDKEDLVWKYHVPGIRYEDVLRQTKLLITDYSSISYDAFYRGSNVIFYWGEKDECMKYYGENSRLMLTEELAFGDVCMNYEQLTEAIGHRYKKEQSEGFINRYRQIVAFHDGKNTERILNKAKKEGLI